MPPKGKKDYNKTSSSFTTVHGGEPSSTASRSLTPEQNQSVAPPLAPIFTPSSPSKGRSPSKRQGAKPPHPPPPTNIMESLVSVLVSLTGVQNEQSTTFRNFVKIIAEVHNFETQCSPHSIALMREMNAFQATITSFTARITAPPPPPQSPQDTNASPPDAILSLTATIIALETAPSPSTPPPPSPSYAAAASKPPDPATTNAIKPPATKTPVTPETTKLQRQLVVTCDPSLPTNITNDAILTSVKNAIETSVVRFVLARRYLKGNLVLQTSTVNTASEDINHGDAMAVCLKDLGCTPTLMRPNAILTSFLLHNVPTPSKPDDVASAIQLNYPTLSLCQQQRWLTTTEKRKEKTHSMMVITLQHKLTTVTLGLSSLSLLNMECRLTLYTPTPVNI
ncbi:hypothetical protein Q9L58_010240 [Maublancomyces gigas]|uniref:Uncharacterized protein n=1 Tax=Discina gigas TaxID=1032678 RepID=A0ABR3G4V7_9PEZI